MIWVDVDTAVIVPVNILPLLDDTDFKTIETAVVYNQAGLVLVGATVGGSLTAVITGQGDGAGDADCVVQLENPDSPLGLTPVSLGQLSTMIDWPFLRLEIVQTSPTAFTAIAYCEGAGISLREVLRVEGLLLGDYGYNNGVTPYLLSLGDTENTPHVHRFVDVAILTEPGPAVRG